MEPRDPISEREADEALAEAELIPLMKGSLADLKRLKAECLERGLPVALGCPDGTSCGPTSHLLAREEDVAQIAALLQAEWRAMVARETGAEPFAMAGHDGGPDGELPCPACGTRAALLEGACSDCGLVLE